MSLRHILVMAAFALSSVAVHADTFAFNAGFASAGSHVQSEELGTGTITIDRTTGLVTAVDITLTVYRSGEDVGSEVFGGAGFIIQQEPAPYYIDYSASNPNGILVMYYQLLITDHVSNAMFLGFPVSSLVGYSGSSLCKNDSTCPNVSVVSFNFDGLSGTDDANFATLQEIPVPEAPTFFLLGTGVLGLVGGIRRRWWLG